MGERGTVGMTKPIRDRILKAHGLTVVQSAKHKHRRLMSQPATISNRNKTTAMLFIELRFGKPIEELLLSGSLSIVAKKLGISCSTASKWIKRLRLRYSETNLPNCKGCVEYHPVCDAGLCNILITKELWHLIDLKKQELLGQSTPTMPEGVSSEG